MKTHTCVLLCLLTCAPWRAHAAGSGDAQAPAATPPATAVTYDPERAFQPAQPDFAVITMPTTLRLPRHRLAFRLTHRFGRDLGAGSFGDLAADLFGFDSGAQIGLEFRYAPIRSLQVGLHRTSNRTMSLFSQYSAVRQGRSPVSIDATLAMDGTNNLQGSYSPSVGAVISRTFGRVGALYVQPAWVNNTNPLPSALDDHNDTATIGIGGRLRVRPSVYVVGEVIPRVAGYRPGAHQASFGIEKRAGGHTFQLNFSNGFGTTLPQVARGGTGATDWYIGFNMSRKFF